MVMASSSSPIIDAIPVQARRLPPPCWTHEETTALIDAYRLKWYSLNRGNLKASHWQEVADSVARTCSHVSPPKTSLQCRHKIEKLRKRYRNEKHRSSSSSSWLFFRKMDSMETGAPSPNSDTTDDDHDDADAGSGARFGNQTRSIHRILISNSSSAARRAAGGGGGGGGGRSGASAPRIKIVKREVEEEKNDFVSAAAAAGKRRRRGDSSASAAAAAELVSAIRMLGEGFLRMEGSKMEMAREAEQMRMEMEMKRTEMILESQQRIVDAFLEGFAAKNGSEKVSSPLQQ